MTRCPSDRIATGPLTTRRRLPGAITGALRGLRQKRGRGRRGILPGRGFESSPEVTGSRLLSETKAR